MVDTPQEPFACTRNKHQTNDDRTPHTGIGGAGGGCRRRRSCRHVLLSMQNHTMGVFSLQEVREVDTHVTVFRNKNGNGLDEEFVRHDHITVFCNKNGNSPLLKVNARLRRGGA